MADQMTKSEFMDAHRRALMAGTIRALELPKRLPELMKKRGWPTQSTDLVSVLMGAIVAMRWKAGRTTFRRPHAADDLGGLWPETQATSTAKQIVDTLELDDLLKRM